MPGIRTCRNQRRRRSLPQSGADPGRGLRDGKRAYFYYMFILLITGTVAGVAIGLLASFLLKI